jgi:hypothetical protein
MKRPPTKEAACEEALTLFKDTGSLLGEHERAL